MTLGDHDSAQLQTALAGRFSLERELGRGGLGVVYRARDVALDRAVAIKSLPADLASHPDIRERFLREARTAAALSHPNIVPIHHVDASQGTICFVMAYVEGETLGERVRRDGPLPPSEAGRIIREVAWALAYAHGRGVIHRDIKPDNILLERGSGRAMVTDFGIARVLTRSTLSRDGELTGTLQYMSPEQADPTAVLDGRSDLYALGVTAYYALSGRLPFESEDPVALLAMHLAEPAAPLASVRIGLPARLAEAVDRCLAKSPDARFPNAEALADAVGDAVPAVRPIPPSALHLRDAVNVSFTLVYFPPIAWVLVRLVAPDSAGPVGWTALALALIGLTSPLVAIRECIRAGITLKDIADIFVAQAGVSDATAEINAREVLRVRRWILSPIGRTIYGVIGAGGLWLAAGLLFKAVRSGGQDAWTDIGLSIIPLAIGIIATGVASRFGGVRRWLGSDTTPGINPFLNNRQKITRWLYDNPVMRAGFWLARFTVRAPKAAPIVEQAPTEVLLGRAAGELFDALPKADRARLAAVPAVIHGLERASQVLRARRDQLERAIADAGVAGDSPRRAELVADLTIAREDAGERLKTAVTALENLRLDLLRARADVGTADQLTAALAEAERVGRDVTAALDGRREVDRLIGP
jgi:serine/threonine-protein kinase